MAKEKDEDLLPEFEDDKEEETQFVDETEAEPEPEEELPEEVKKSSKKDLYARVQAAEKKVAEAPDPTERISKAFEDAVGKIRPQEAPLIQQPGETDAAFRERFKTDAFDENKGIDTFNELIDRRIGPRLAQANELNFKQAERIMELDPETGPSFKKYKAEIQAYIKANFPPGVQRDPRVLELAFNQVRVVHVDEIAQERANAILEKERKKDPARREPVPLEAGGGSGGGGGAVRRKILVRTAEDHRKADLAGVDVDVIVARRAARGGK
jgi:hypothetical protein